MSRSQLTSTVEQNTGGPVAPFVAGKNKIINGDFGVWQRGTSFSLNGGTIYTSDRWYVNYDGTGATRTASQQTFAAGTAPVAGYEGTYFYRLATTVAGSGQTYSNFTQPIEDVRIFAGQTVTLSFWAKADSNRTISPGWGQQFGSGGSSAVYGSFSTASLTTSWQRFSSTVSINSIAGKTIGASSKFEINLGWPGNSTFTIDFWGVQLEAGSVATPFTTATNTVQGELAACQRYYNRFNITAYYPSGIFGNAISTTNARIGIALGTQMRIAPATLDYANIYLSDGATSTTLTALDSTLSSTSVGLLNGTVASGLTQFRGYNMAASSSAGYIGFSAEL